MRRFVANTVVTNLFIAGLSVVVHAQAAPPPPAPVPPAVAPPPPAPPTEPKAEVENDVARKKWRFGGGVYYSVSDKLRFPNAKSDTGSGEREYDLRFETEGAPGVALETRYDAPNAWGFQAGLAFDAKRKLKNFESDLSGTRVTTDLNDSTIQISTLYVNILYKWNEFYIPFGVNFALARYENRPTLLEKVDGGSGGQFGVGWDFNPHLSLEFLGRVTGLQGRSHREGNVTTSNELGSMLSAQAFVKGYF